MTNDDSIQKYGHKPFYIKTIQIFDENLRLITEILTEMIDDKVLFQADDPTIEFDTSIHFFKNKMLYFKRQFYNEYD
jgi:predicted TIM-barrel fold metal-dependent hydrolase